MFGQNSQSVTAISAIHVVVELYTDLSRSITNKWAEEAYFLSIYAVVSLMIYVKASYRGKGVNLTMNESKEQ